MNRRTTSIKRVSVRSIFIASFLIGMFILFKFTNNDAMAESSRTLTCTSVMVEDEDTLWSLASEYYSEEYGNIYNHIKAIKKTNNLTSDTIKSGYNIIIPYYQ